MPPEPLLHVAFVGVLCALALIRLVSRLRAGRAQWLPAVGREGWAIVVLRTLLAAPVFALAFLHAFAPDRAGALQVACPAWLRAAGLVPALAGLGLLAWTHRTLDRHWSPSLRLQDDHRLLTSGPYAFVRHPMYLAYLLLFPGLGLLAADPWLALAGEAVIAVLVVLRVPREERLLEERFGEAWSTWAARTGRLFPRRAT